MSTFSTPHADIDPRLTELLDWQSETGVVKLSLFRVGGATP